MNADVRVIQLMRKIICDQNEVQAMDETDQSDYFATDYFDVMKVEKKDLSSSLTSIMGICSNEKIGVLDVAAQSFSLYCSEKMLEVEKDSKECGDPFFSKDKNMQFLSIIQVHITPEVMAHELKIKSTKEFIDAVYEDLHVAVMEFIKAYNNDSFIFRIYKMLSAGDFAIVLRSGNAESSFKLSSLLRRRIMTDLDEKNIVLYKTYTILTFGNDIIRQEVERQGDDSEITQGKALREDRFVLRCRYSNLYWSNKEKVDEYLKKENILSKTQIYGLNGRYDFSVRITERQFLELLYDIKAYKETGMGLSEDKIEKDTTNRKVVTEEDGIVKYMRYLMENHYLSYINERYLVAQDGIIEKLNVILENKSSTTICASAIKSREDFLDNKINALYKSIAEKCQIVRHKVDQIKDYRKNMKHYMDLLAKLAKHCYVINGFSDTRIYAAILLEQLDVIMYSIGVYVEIYQNAEEEESESILEFLEEYIRESVCALDGYAQYIRNNNLQSLQTPNYNIESNMGMEKLLIGYSEFLRVFTQFYQRSKMDENQFKYLPIVVPVLSNRDLSVETLFPKGVMNNWDKEKKLRNRLSNGSDWNQYDRCCMVISVPTLTELGDVYTMVTSLFHEVAHQFRYESRKERNDALLSYVIHRSMRDIINEMIHKLQNDAGVREWDIDVRRSLETSLVEAYLETNYMNNGLLDYYFQEAPLINFQYCLKHDLNDILGSWGQKSDIRSVLHAFLKEIMYYYQSECSHCPEAIEILDKLFEQIEKGEIEETLSDKVVKCAYGLSWECACQNIDNVTNRIWESGGFRNWLEEEDNEFGYQEKWVEVFENVDLDTESESCIEKIWNNFYIFSSWIYDHCGNNERIHIYNIIKRTEFIDKAYQKMCDAWAREDIQDKLVSDLDRTISTIGRALGIDCNTKENYIIFKQQITYAVNQSINYIIGFAEWRIRKYREETADMFMCNAMNLTPFGYMYMLAANWPSNRELPNEYSSRSLNLLLFQWCLDENGIISYNKFRELCVELIQTLEGAISRAVVRLIEMGEKLNLPQYLDDPVKWDKDDAMQVINLLDRIEISMDYCKELEEKIVNRQNTLIKRECEMLKFYSIMAHMMDQLIDQGKYQIKYFDDFKELRDDYVRGIKHLKDLNNEMCTDDDPLVQQLGEFCKEISILQNEPYLMIESVGQIEKINADSIEFLLNMHYENIRRVAQQIGGK